MPTTAGKNMLYRAALPFLSPRVPANAVKECEGHPLASRVRLESLLRKHHVSGGALCLRAGNEEARVFTAAVHTDMIPDSGIFFRVASITKMATALLAVTLMDRGLLDPDAHAAGFLPDGESVPELQGVKIRHLLAHNSGLSDPPNLESFLDSGRPYREAVSGRRVSEPGTVFRYSNLGFGLLGCIFESVLDLPLEEAFQQTVFRPLGMNATLSASTLDETKIMPVIRMLPYREDTALRITKLGRLRLTVPDPAVHYGYSAGSMYTDLPSLLALLSCIRDDGRPLLSGTFGSFMRIKTNDYGKASPTLSYGHGLLMIRDSSVSRSVLLGHQGFAYGCVDGAFWEDDTGNILLSLNGGCSEARTGRLGLANRDLCRWAFSEEMAAWK